MIQLINQGTILAMETLSVNKRNRKLGRLHEKHKRRSEVCNLSMTALPKTQNRLITIVLKHSDPPKPAPLSYGQETSKTVYVWLFLTAVKVEKSLPFWLHSKST